GTRKLDVGDLNAVEASVIDTALFQFGALTFGAGFATNPEIQQRVGRILDRTLWPELIDPQSGRLFLAWKPMSDNDPDGPYLAPASFGGFWAGQAGAPATIDIWTDEGGLAAILAVGSQSHPVNPKPWYRMLRAPGHPPCGATKVTFPGAWFT